MSADEKAWNMLTEEEKMQWFDGSIQRYNELTDKKKKERHNWIISMRARKGKHAKPRHDNKREKN